MTHDSSHNQTTIVHHQQHISEGEGSTDHQPEPHWSVQREPLASPLQIGDIFEGFLIEEQLGQGGYGSVYAAQDLGLDRPVAIKIFTRETDHHAAQRFRDEGRLLAKLDHPHIIQVFRVGTSQDGHLFLAMERFGTGSLHKHWPQGMCPHLHESCHIIRQLLSALDAAHHLNVVHRDIKEGNVLYDLQSRQVKLCDFGIARAVDRLENQAQTTREGAVIGTEHYIAPERYQGNSHDPRSDLYSVGVLFFRLLTGRRPLERFPGEQLPIEVRFYRLFHEALPVLEEIPRSLARICLRLIAVEPDDRYQTAAQAQRDLAEAMQEPETTSAPQSSLPQVFNEGQVISSSSFNQELVPPLLDLDPATQTSEEVSSLLPSSLKSSVNLHFIPLIALLIGIGLGVVWWLTLEQTQQKSSSQAVEIQLGHHVQDTLVKPSKPSSHPLQPTTIQKPHVSPASSQPKLKSHSAKKTVKSVHRPTKRLPSKRRKSTTPSSPFVFPSGPSQ